MYRARPPPDQLASNDLGDALRELAGDSAVIRASSGGFEIVVNDAASYPWAKVFGHLLDIGQDVWLQRRDGLMVIRSKPPAI